MSVFVFEAPIRDLGDGVAVRRPLPSVKRRSVGPFVFLDHIGPFELPPGKGMDVRPHPHIGLATMTWLFEGRLLHRDSTGAVQAIAPGEVNWMSAGRGIVHSERVSDEDRARGQRVHGLQFWVALPEADEEGEPSFVHHGRPAIPAISGPGWRGLLVVGADFGERSPVIPPSPMIFADLHLQTGARLALPPHDELAVYVIEGEVQIGDTHVGPGQFGAFGPHDHPHLDAPQGAWIALIGGQALDGPRKMFWNFVSSSPERIEQAKLDWKEGRFPQVPGETEFIPLPG